MKQNRINLLLAAVISSVLLCQNANAVMYQLSQIVGYNTGNLGADSATGTLDGWNNPTGNVTVTNGAGSLDGTSLGLAASDGDRAFINSTLALNVRNSFALSNGMFNPNIAPGFTNYYSFLYRFRVGTDVTNVGGQVVIRMNKNNSGTGTPQYWDLLARRVGADIQLGLTKPLAPNNATNWATTNLSAGQTFFVVVRQQCITGPTNDVTDLWINPPPATFYTNEANVPVPSCSIGLLGTDGAEDTSTTGPGRFVVAAGASAEFDEFRCASTWAEVTPYFGQCIGAGVSRDPLSVTNSAEIAATFRVTSASTTSPTYQWQLSQDSGATWNHISGGTFFTYTTPNLALATDNGNKYRAIITAPCDGSKATSAVATVTLTAPVVTPVGLIMDDNFSDTFRGNLPLSTNNSLWWTSIAGTANLDNAAGTALIAIPLPGTSSLWWGNFVSESTTVPSTNLPVHLAVNRAIRVTLPFVITSFSQHTNNGALRFGLYDYADGGTIFTADSAAATGSAGNGTSVRGYMLSLDFGTNFTSSSPMSLLARTALVDNNLMGTTSDYVSLGSGPSGGGYSNAPAFLAISNYTLVFQVTRTDVNTCRVSTSITGGGTNWMYSTIDTNYAYHRFDVFAIRPNSLETSADQFEISRFLVQVLDTSVPAITNVVSGSDLTLSWDTNYIGWTLVSQTNTTAVGLVNNPGSWTTVSGSAATNKVIIPMDKTKGTVFFRLTN